MTPPPDAKRGRSVASVVLGDRVVESIYDAARYQTRLVTLHEGALEEHECLATSEGRLIPFSASNNLLSHRVVLLPSGVKDYGHVDELVTRIRTFIHRYADVSDSFEELASYYVLLTWVYDAFNELPYLRLQGNFGSGKSRCLQTIGSICYKPMMASGASTVSPLFRIMDAFRGTLVLDESDFRLSDEKAEIIKILNNGNAAGFPVLRCDVTPTKEFSPRAFNVFGPKIIATRGPFEDPALESRCFTETMSGLPPRSDIPVNLPSCFHDEALELRNQLLFYRFRNRLRPFELAADRSVGVDVRVSQLLAPLLAVVEDPGAAARLRGLAQIKTAMLLSEREASVESELLDIMFQMRSERAPLVLGDIADRFTTVYGEGYAWPITPRWIGSQIRSRLAIVPARRRGRFVVADEDPRLLQLFKRFGINREEVPVA